MSRLSPAAALNKTRSGNVCDQCNRRIRTGDKAVVYATYYDADGWVIRRVWCDECANREIGLPTHGADQIVVEAVYWSARLVGVTTVDRSQP
jgi:hypothetical protein